MSLRWIRHVQVDGEPTTLEIMMGNSRMADKCYVRIGADEEYWFRPTADSRDAILDYGLLLLQEKLNGHHLTTPGGAPYHWN
jgi:hypothetical protein